jgi:hypothetical protein
MHPGLAGKSIDRGRGTLVTKVYEELTPNAARTWPGVSSACLHGTVPKRIKISLTRKVNKS